MNRLRLRGWRLDNLNNDALVAAIGASDAQPAICETAIKMILSMPLSRAWTPNTIMWYRCQARRVIRDILMANPGQFGLERIDPAIINTSMSSAELARFCHVPLAHVYKLAGGAPENGLPRPDWPLGRTLRGRSWRFVSEVARQYAEKLLEGG